MISVFIALMSCRGNTFLKYASSLIHVDYFLEPCGDVTLSTLRVVASER